MGYTVYQHITPNGKRYIGITKSKPENRWNGGYGYKTQPLFYRAIKKYGWDNIKHQVLVTGISKGDATKTEIRLIAQYDCTNPQKGYNITKGGDGCNGFSPSPETRKKLSDAHKGKNATWYGKHLPEDMRKQISEKIKRLWHNAEYRQKRVDSQKGTKHTNEHKRKIGDASRRNWQNKEFRTAHLEWLRKAWTDEASRKKRIASITKAWQDKNLRQRQREANSGKNNGFFGKKHTPETRLLLAEISRGKCGALHPRSKPVMQYALDGTLIERHESASMASKKVGVFASAISLCCSGKLKSTGGFLWKRPEEEVAK